MNIKRDTLDKNTEDKKPKTFAHTRNKVLPKLFFRVCVVRPIGIFILDFIFIVILRG